MLKLKKNRLQNLNPLLIPQVERKDKDFQNVIWQLNVMVHDNLNEYVHDICLLQGVLLKSESPPSLVCMACP